MIKTSELPPLPEFNFNEIEKLYRYDLTLPDEIYESLLQKDRKLLTKDLETLLQHAVRDYEVFSRKDFPAEHTFFVWHALFLLKDLEVSESLPAVLEFLTQDDEVITFYSGDLLSEYGWEFLYVLGLYNLRTVVNFYKDLKDIVDFILRPVILKMLSQLAFRHPERSLEIESYLRELLIYASTTPLSEDINIDDAALNLVECVGLGRFTRLYPFVKKLLDEKSLPLYINITSESFGEEYVLAEPDTDDPVIQFSTRKEVYADYLEAKNEMEKNKDDDDDDIYDPNFDEELDKDIDDYFAKLESNVALEDMKEAEKKSTLGNTPFVNTQAGIGRNNPCPCGSGKKYKKCHGKG